MAYNNFKSMIWSKHIQHELPKFTVFEQDCDYKFKGEVKNGKTVKILGVGKPTIGDYVGKDIGAPETVPDSSAYLVIDQAKFFNFQVDDVDEAQATEGLMPALMTESTRAMAEQRDKFIAALAKDAGHVTNTAQINTGAAMKTAIDKGFTWLWANGVSTKDDVTIYLTPWACTLLLDKFTELSTDNVEYIKKGILGHYKNAKIKMSNNIYNDKTDDYLVIKTSKAIAFCGGIDKVEAYRPQGLFSDAVKGLNTYGGKVVRPKEMYVIKAHE